MSAQSGGRSSSWTVCPTTTPRMTGKLRGAAAFGGTWGRTSGNRAQIKLDKLDLKAKLLLGAGADAVNLFLPSAEPFSLFIFFYFLFKRLVLVGTGTTKKGSAQDQTCNSGSTVWSIFCFKAELSYLVFLLWEARSLYRFVGFWSTAGLEYFPTEN